MRPPTPADSGGSVLGTPVVSGAVRGPSGHGGAVPSPAAGLLAAPVAEALAIMPDQSEHLADAGLQRRRLLRPAAADRYDVRGGSSALLPRSSVDAGDPVRPAARWRDHG